MTLRLPIKYKMSLSAPFPFSQVGQPLAQRRKSSVRKRMWQTVIALAAIWTLIIGRDIHDRLTDPSPKLSLGHDLIPSYAAGVLVREGRPRDMYDRPALTKVEFQMIDQANLNRGDRYGPWLNPPFFAWMFAPLSMLPYRQAAAVFLGFNLTIFVITLALVWRLFAPLPVRIPGLTPGHFANAPTFILAFLLAILPLPFWQVMGHQQNTFISLLLITLTVSCWHRDKRFMAGLIAGLLFFKPQLAVVFAAIVVVGLGWRALVGLAVTGFVLLAITLVSMPGCLGDFLFRLPPILHWLQVESPYAWGRQVTFQSFWRLLIQGQVRGETTLLVKILWWLSSGLMATAIGAAGWKFFKGNRSPISRDRVIAAAIVSMPMIMPYYMDYDLLLLIIPAALLAREWIRRPDLITTSDHWLPAVWLTFCLESHFNPGLSSEFHAGKWMVSHLPLLARIGHLEQAHLNLAVPLLTTISLLHIWRCLRGSADPICTVASTSEGAGQFLRALS